MIRTRSPTPAVLVSSCALTLRVRRMTLPVLSHRLVLNPEARMKGVMAGQVLSSLLEQVAVPVSRRK